ncbi:MAG TPA: hypothetical protein VGM28_01755 [Candidatus Limnocylindrales bacterium]|jgi:hypothetical protein
MDDHRPGTSELSEGSPLVVAERGARAPWAASVAGLLFAAMFTGSLFLLRGADAYTVGDHEINSVFARGNDLPVVIGGLYLAPFAGIMFLWFVAVIRDQIGEREDRFFATVFFGSGLLFTGMLWIAAAIASAPSVGVRYLGEAPPSAETLDLLRAIVYTVAFVFADRAAAVFMFATATIGLRTGVLPRWFSIVTYLLGTVLLVVVTVFDLAILVLPAWVAALSLLILRREMARRRAT